MIPWWLRAAVITSLKQEPTLNTNDVRSCMLFYRLMGVLRPRLVTALLLAFSLLVMPVLILVVTVSQYQSEHAIRIHLDAELGRTRVDFDRAIAGFFGPLMDVTGILGSAASMDPAAVRKDAFNELLHQTISSMTHIVSLTVAFEDGFARNFARITPAMRNQHPQYPQGAQWVMRTSSRAPAAPEGRFEEVFYGEYPHVIASSHPTSMADFVETDSYLGAERAGQLYIGVTTGVASGLPVVSMATPMKRDGVFTGAVTANVTLSEISEFLSRTRISDNTESLILDENGQIVAASSLADSNDVETSGLAASPIPMTLMQRRVLAVDALQKAGKGDRGTNGLTADVEGTEYSIMDFPIENRFGLNYRALILTPLDDFVGDLRQSRRQFAIIMAFLVLFEVALIVSATRRMSQRLGRLSGMIERIRGMNFDDSDIHLDTPPVQEMAELQRGIALLQNALRSFALYVPLGLVRRLVEDGRTIAPGVARREMTILFCDLEGFSMLAQAIPAEELLEYTTQYFSIATDAITRHGGTVDKFIGDAVMGFWGAPQPVADHAVRACRAAIDIVRGLERANMAWAAQGKRSLRVRVGINSASVLVGNIGSPDRLSYTTIGDGVNVASRLEGKNKDLGSQICISDSTYEAARDQIVARPLKPISVKGRNGEFMVYELLDVAAVGTSAHTAAQRQAEAVS